MTVNSLSVNFDGAGGSVIAAAAKNDAGEEVLRVMVLAGNGQPLAWFAMNPGHALELGQFFKSWSAEQVAKISVGRAAEKK